MASFGLPMWSSAPSLLLALLLLALYQLSDSTVIAADPYITVCQQRITGQSLMYGQQQAGTTVFLDQARVAAATKAGRLTKINTYNSPEGCVTGIKPVYATGAAMSQLIGVQHGMKENSLVLSADETVNRADISYDSRCIRYIRWYTNSTRTASVGSQRPSATSKMAVATPAQPTQQLMAFKAMLNGTGALAKLQLVWGESMCRIVQAAVLAGAPLSGFPNTTAVPAELPRQPASDAAPAPVVASALVQSAVSGSTQKHTTPPSSKAHSNTVMKPAEGSTPVAKQTAAVGLREIPSAVATSKGTASIVPSQPAAKAVVVSADSHKQRPNVTQQPAVMRPGADGAPPMAVAVQSTLGSSGLSDGGSAAASAANAHGIKPGGQLYQPTVNATGALKQAFTASPLPAGSSLLAQTTATASAADSEGSAGASLTSSRMRLAAPAVQGRTPAAAQVLKPPDPLMLALGAISSIASKLFGAGTRDATRGERRFSAQQQPFFSREDDDSFAGTDRSKVAGMSAGTSPSLISTQHQPSVTTLGIRASDSSRPTRLQQQQQPPTGQQQRRQQDRPGRPLQQGQPKPHGSQRQQQTGSAAHRSGVQVSAGQGNRFQRVDAVAAANTAGVNASGAGNGSRMRSSISSTKISLRTQGPRGPVAKQSQWLAVQPGITAMPSAAVGDNTAGPELLSAGINGLHVAAPSANTSEHTSNTSSSATDTADHLAANQPTTVVKQALDQKGVAAAPVEPDHTLSVVQQHTLLVPPGFGYAAATPGATTAQAPATSQQGRNSSTATLSEAVTAAQAAQPKTAMEPLDVAPQQVSATQNGLTSKADVGSPLAPTVLASVQNGTPPAAVEVPAGLLVPTAAAGLVATAAPTPISDMQLVMGQLQLANDTVNNNSSDAAAEVEVEARPAAAAPTTPAPASAGLATGMSSSAMSGTTGAVKGDRAASAPQAAGVAMLQNVSAAAAQKQGLGTGAGGQPLLAAMAAVDAHTPAPTMAQQPGGVLAAQDLGTLEAQSAAALLSAMLIQDPAMPATHDAATRTASADSLSRLAAQAAVASNLSPAVIAAASAQVETPPSAVAPAPLAAPAAEATSPAAASAAVPSTKGTIMPAASKAQLGTTLAVTPAVQLPVVQSANLPVGEATAAAAAAAEAPVLPLADADRPAAPAVEHTDSRPAAPVVKQPSTPPTLPAMHADTAATADKIQLPDATQRMAAATPAETAAQGSLPPPAVAAPAAQRAAIAAPTPSVAAAEPAPSAAAEPVPIAAAEPTTPIAADLAPSAAPAEPRASQMPSGTPVSVSDGNSSYWRVFDDLLPGTTTQDTADGPMPAAGAMQPAATAAGLNTTKQMGLTQHVRLSFNRQQQVASPSRAMAKVMPNTTTHSNPPHHHRQQQRQQQQRRRSAGQSQKTDVVIEAPTQESPASSASSASSAEPADLTPAADAALYRQDAPQQPPDMQQQQQTQMQTVQQQHNSTRASQPAASSLKISADRTLMLQGNHSRQQHRLHQNEHKITSQASQQAQHGENQTSPARPQPAPTAHNVMTRNESQQQHAPADTKIADSQQQRQQQLGQHRRRQQQQQQQQQQQDRTEGPQQRLAQHRTWQRQHNATNSTGLLRQLPMSAGGPPTDGIRPVLTDTFNTTIHSSGRHHHHRQQQQQQQQQQPSARQSQKTDVVKPAPTVEEPVSATAVQPTNGTPAVAMTSTVMLRQDRQQQQQHPNVQQRQKQKSIVQGRQNSTQASKAAAASLKLTADRTVVLPQGNHSRQQHQQRQHEEEVTSQASQQAQHGKHSTRAAVQPQAPTSQKVTTRQVAQQHYEPAETKPAASQQQQQQQQPRRQRQQQQQQQQNVTNSSTSTSSTSSGINLLTPLPIKVAGQPTDVIEPILIDIFNTTQSSYHHQQQQQQQRRGRPRSTGHAQRTDVGKAAATKQEPTFAAAEPANRPLAADMANTIMHRQDRRQQQQGQKQVQAVQGRQNSTQAGTQAAAGLKVAAIHTVLAPRQNHSRQQRGLHQREPEIMLQASPRSQKGKNQTRAALQQPASHNITTEDLSPQQQAPAETLPAEVQRQQQQRQPGQQWLQQQQQGPIEHLQQLWVAWQQQHNTTNSTGQLTQLPANASGLAPDSSQPVQAVVRPNDVTIAVGTHATGASEQDVAPSQSHSSASTVDPAAVTAAAPARPAAASAAAPPTALPTPPSPSPQPDGAAPPAAVGLKPPRTTPSSQRLAPPSCRARPAMCDATVTSPDHPAHCPVAAPFSNPQCVGGCCVSSGKCSSSDCSSSGLGRGAPHMMCQGLGSYGGFGYDPSGDTVCRHLACRLAVPGCMTGPSGGNCIGKVVALATAGEIHPDGLRLLGSPCLEVMPGDMPLHLDGSSSQQGEFVARLWSVCDCQAEDTSASVTAGADKHNDRNNSRGDGSSTDDVAGMQQVLTMLLDSASSKTYNGSTNNSLGVAVIDAGSNSAAAQAAVGTSTPALQSVQAGLANMLEPSRSGSSATAAPSGPTLPGNPGASSTSASGNSRASGASTPSDGIAAWLQLLGLGSTTGMSTVNGDSNSSIAHPSQPGGASDQDMQRSNSVAPAANSPAGDAPPAAVSKDMLPNLRLRNPSAPSQWPSNPSGQVYAPLPSTDKQTAPSYPLSAAAAGGFTGSVNTAEGQDVSSTGQPLGGLADVILGIGRVAAAALGQTNGSSAGNSAALTSNPTTASDAAAASKPVASSAVPAVGLGQLAAAALAALRNSTAKAGAGNNAAGPTSRNSSKSSMAKAAASGPPPNPDTAASDDVEEDYGDGVIRSGRYKGYISSRGMAFSRSSSSSSSSGSSGGSSGSSIAGVNSSNSIQGAGISNSTQGVYRTSSSIPGLANSQSIGGVGSGNSSTEEVSSSNSSIGRVGSGSIRVGNSSSSSGSSSSYGGETGLSGASHEHTGVGHEVMPELPPADHQSTTAARSANSHNTKRYKPVQPSSGRATHHGEHKIRSAATGTAPQLWVATVVADSHDRPNDTPTGGLAGSSTAQQASATTDNGDDTTDWQNGLMGGQVLRTGPGGTREALVRGRGSSRTPTVPDQHDAADSSDIAPAAPGRSSTHSSTMLRVAEDRAQRSPGASSASDIAGGGSSSSIVTRGNKHRGEGGPLPQLTPLSAAAAAGDGSETIRSRKIRRSAMLTGGAVSSRRLLLVKQGRTLAQK